MSLDTASGYAAIRSSADLPIEQTTKFELVVNMKTANTLGITISESILLRTRRGDTVRRRDFVCGLAALFACPGPLGLPSVADAQQPASPRRIGVVTVSVTEQQELAQTFRQALADSGYQEGRDIFIEWRYAAGSYDNVPPLVADLVQRNVDVIVVETTPAALAAKRATSTIPVVMTLVGDPVGSGVVESLGRPGGNITGLTNQTIDMMAKRLQLLKEAMPRAVRVVVPYNPGVPYAGKAIEILKAAAPGLGIRLTFVPLRTVGDVHAAFSDLSRSTVDALLPIDDAVMVGLIGEILQITSRTKVPVVFAYTPLARSGGVLISYAVDPKYIFSRAALYVDKILKGAKPADLPIEQPTKFVMVVNLQAAKALGITIPESILLRADEVIR
jgi:putative ABC transport system substrate-binding protein